MREIILIAALIMSLLAVSVQIAGFVCLFVIHRRHCCKQCAFQYDGRCLITYEELKNLKKPNNCGRFIYKGEGGPV